MIPKGRGLPALPRRRAGSGSSWTAASPTSLRDHVLGSATAGTVFRQPSRQRLTAADSVRSFPRKRESRPLPLGEGPGRGPGRETQRGGIAAAVPVPAVPPSGTGGTIGGPPPLARRPIWYGCTPTLSRTLAPGRPMGSPARSSERRPLMAAAAPISPATGDLAERESELYMRTFVRIPVALARGEGVRVWDVAGNEISRFLWRDCGSTCSATCHPGRGERRDGAGANPHPTPPASTTPRRSWSWGSY